MGFFAGWLVDAYVGAMGSNANFTVGWPTKMRNVEFIVDRLLAGNLKLWRHAEHLSIAFETDIAPERVKIKEAQRLSIGFWFCPAMND